MKKVKIVVSYHKHKNEYEALIHVRIPCERNDRPNFMYKKGTKLTKLLICDQELLGATLDQYWGTMVGYGYRVRLKSIYNHDLLLLIKATEEEVKKIKEIIEKIKESKSKEMGNSLPLTKTEYIDLEAI